MQGRPHFQDADTARQGGSQFGVLMSVWRPMSGNLPRRGRRASLASRRKVQHNSSGCLSLHNCFSRISCSIPKASRRLGIRSDVSD